MNLTNKVIIINTKKIISSLLCAALLLSALPMLSGAVTNGVQTKINELLEVYAEGTYFTSDGEPCSSAMTDRCNIENIPSRGGLPSGKEVSDCDYQGYSYSCRAFGNYVYYYLFGCHYSNPKNISCADDPHLGDFILFNNGSHTAIYLWEDADYYYVYDGNGDHLCGVHYNHAFKKSSYRITGAYHYYDYDKVNAGQDYSFTVPSSGSFYFKNVKTGAYLTKDLTVSDERREGPCNIAVTNNGGSFSIANYGPSGYLTVGREYALGSSAYINDYSSWRLAETTGGYLIYNVRFPDICLTKNGDTVTAEKFSGSSNQLWKLEHSEHNYIEEVIQKATCEEYGYSKFTCGCGISFYEYTAPAGHTYGGKKTVRPTAASCGFDKRVCTVCGHIGRDNFTNRTGTAAVSAPGVKISGSYAIVSPDLSDEDFGDLFPEFIPLATDTVKVTGSYIYSYMYSQGYYVIVAGDADGNGSQDINDARLTLRSAIGLEEVNEYGVIAADMDGDGDLTVNDARFELRLAIGLENTDAAFSAVKVP